ncbi:aspartyl protease family protein At5g10770-like [Primulina huaijiensis]|uniref:aspartyl protease family protein At5g10770-like n=1 Tax=Primulina huaijiensis TaxID=1492673 RepID=UPI003CC6F906
MQMAAVKLVICYTSLFFISVSCFLKNVHVLEGIREGDKQSFGLYHTTKISYLSPSSVCNPSKTQGRNKKQSSTLEVVHRHGPCSDQLGQENAKTKPSLSEVLSHDQSRVDYIQAQLVQASNMNKPEDIEVNIPARSGIPLESNYYVVSLGLGTPKQPLSLAFDTGGDLTWTQCQPCLESCYKQQDPMFNPSASSSYSNISCNSRQCSQLFSGGTGIISSGCVSGTCVYGVQYGVEDTFSSGFLGKETLTLAPGDEISNFLFGCGQYNAGKFGKIAGVLGLGKSHVSIVSQTSQKYGKYFSYCLPSTPSSIGHLTFGKNRVSRNVEFTPLVNSQRNTPFYFIDVTSITVGGRKLPIKPEAFKSPGTIIDSGTVITRLHPATYAALRATFTQMMGKSVPRAPPLGILDTCYDLRKVTPESIPGVAFTFGGNVTIDSPYGAYVYDDDTSRLCLAFAANKDVRDVSIFGSTQQQSLEVAFDVAGGKIGFGYNGCD